MDPELEQEIAFIREETDRELNKIRKGVKVNYGEQVKEELGNMGSAHKVWYAKAIAGAVVSDGVVTEEEKGYLNKVIDFLDDKEESKRIMKIVNKKEIPQLEYLKDIDPGFSKRILISLAKIVVADTKLEHKEVMYLKMVSDRLGISDELREKILALATAMLKVEESKKLVLKLEKQIRSM